MLKRIIPPSYINSLNAQVAKMNVCQKLLMLGIEINSETGHIHYNENFIPLNLNFEFVFVRHGETYGNCGQSTNQATIDIKAVKSNFKDSNKRIFQGDIDSEINQLTIHGLMQAYIAAYQLEQQLLKKGWIPDLILHSPLSRAKQTGFPFVIRNKFKDRFISHQGIKEMSFGSWENRRICDFPPDESCHAFYRDQHALVKSSGINGNGVYQVGENFSEVLLRAYQVLQELSHIYQNKKIIMFSHSMFGAACCILLGKGKKFKDENYLAFDGKSSNGESYTIPHATPFIMNFKI